MQLEWWPQTEDEEGMIPDTCMRHSTHRWWEPMAICTLAMPGTNGELGHDGSERRFHKWRVESEVGIEEFVDVDVTYMENIKAVRVEEEILKEAGYSTAQATKMALKKLNKKYANVIMPCKKRKALGNLGSNYGRSSS